MRVKVIVNVSPSGSGNVDVDGAFPRSYPYTRRVEKGTFVSLEAVPAPGYHFTDWSGDLDGSENPTEIRGNLNKTVTAHFLLDAREFASEDGRLNIFIPEGTTALDEEGNPLTSLEIIVDETPPAPPPETNIVGIPYNLEPGGATFDQLTTITWNYDPDEISPGVAEEDLVLAYYDEAAGEWVELPSVVDPVNNTITARVDHLTIFAIIAPVPPPVPAAFTTSSLSISPPEVSISEMVSISILVTNTGEEEGSYTVTLKINEVIEETKEITLAGGSETVSFTTAKDEVGTYSVSVNGLSGSFTVKEVPLPGASPPAPASLPATLAGVKWAILGPILAVVVFLTTFLLIRLRRRTW